MSNWTCVGIVCGGIVSQVRKQRMLREDIAADTPQQSRQASQRKSYGPKPTMMTGVENLKEFSGYETDKCISEEMREL